MFNDEEEDENAIGAVRYPCMPSLVALQQMRNRLHLAYLGRKLMKWTALATGRELRRLAMEINTAYNSFAEDLRNAFMLLARGRYFYPNLNKMVLENVPNKSSVLVASSTKTISGVKVIQYDIVESGVEPYEHLGIEKGGQKIHEAKIAWLDLLKRMVLMLELRTSFSLVETAHKNATKKGNVLSKIIVPRLMVTTQYILSELEEKEREETFRLKKVKQNKMKGKEFEGPIAEEDEETTETPEKSSKVDKPVIMPRELNTEKALDIPVDESTVPIVADDDSLLFYEGDGDINSAIFEEYNDAMVKADILRKILEDMEKAIQAQEEPDMKMEALIDDKMFDDLEKDVNDAIKETGDFDYKAEAAQIYGSSEEKFEQKIESSESDSKLETGESDSKENSELEDDKILEDVPGSSKGANEPDTSEKPETADESKKEPDKKDEEPDSDKPAGGNDMVVLQVEGLIRISDAILPFAMLTLETMNEFDDLFDGEWDYLNNLPEIKMPKMDISRTLALSTMAKEKKHDMNPPGSTKLTCPTNKSLNKLAKDGTSSVGNKDSNKVIVIDNKKSKMNTSSGIFESAEETLQEIKDLILKMKIAKERHINSNTFVLPKIISPKTGSVSKTKLDLNFRIAEDEQKEKDEREMRVIALSQSDHTKNSIGSDFNIDRSSYHIPKANLENVIEVKNIDDNKLVTKKSKSPSSNKGSKNEIITNKIRNSELSTEQTDVRTVNAESNSYISPGRSGFSLSKMKPSKELDETSYKREDTASKHNKSVKFYNELSNNENEISQSNLNTKLTIYQDESSEMVLNNDVKQRFTQEHNYNLLDLEVISKTSDNVINPFQVVDSLTMDMKSLSRRHLSQNVNEFEGNDVNKTDHDENSILICEGTTNLNSCNTSFEHNNEFGKNDENKKTVNDFTFADLDRDITANGRETTQPKLSVFSSKNSSSDDESVDLQFNIQRPILPITIKKKCSNQQENKDGTNTSKSIESTCLKPLVIKSKCKITDGKEIYRHVKTEIKPVTMMKKYHSSNDIDDIFDSDVFLEDLTFASDDSLSDLSVELHLCDNDDKRRSNRLKLSKMRLNSSKSKKK